MTTNPQTQDQPLNSRVSDETPESGQEPPETAEGHTEAETVEQLQRHFDRVIHQVQESNKRKDARLRARAHALECQVRQIQARQLSPGERDRVVEFLAEWDANIAAVDELTKDVTEEQVIQMVAHFKRPSPLPPPAPTKTTGEVLGEIAHEIEGHTRLCDEPCSPCRHWNAAIQAAMKCVREAQQ